MMSVNLKEIQKPNKIRGCVNIESSLEAGSPVVIYFIHIGNNKK